MQTPLWKHQRTRSRAPVLLVWQMLLNDCRAPIQAWGGEGQVLVWAWGGGTGAGMGLER